MYMQQYTVNQEYLVVKIFSDSLACAKIKHAKYMCIIISNVVQGRLSENYLARKFIARNIHVLQCLLHVIIIKLKSWHKQYQ